MDTREFNLAKMASQSILEALISRCKQRNFSNHEKVDMLIYKQDGTIVALNDETCSYDVQTSPYLGNEGGIYDLLVNEPGKVVYIPISKSMVLTCNLVGFKPPKSANTTDFIYGIPCISDGFFVSVGIGSSKSARRGNDSASDAYNVKGLTGRTIIMVRGSQKEKASVLSTLLVPSIIESKKPGSFPFQGKVKDSEDDWNMLSAPINLKLGQTQNGKRDVFVLKNIVAMASHFGQFSRSAKVAVDSEWKVYSTMPTFT